MRCGGVACDGGGDDSGGSDGADWDAAVANFVAFARLTELVPNACVAAVSVT